MSAHAGHSHAHRHDDARRMAIVLAINVVMLVIGIGGGLLFDSLALLADAGHVLTDVLGIGIALFAGWMARRPAGPQRTFGFRRGEIFAALFNGFTLVAIAVLVFVAAIGRLSNPPSVEGGGVIVVGLLSLLANAGAALVLAGGDRTNVNLEGVLRHTAADALGALGVVLAGLIVVTTGWQQADAVVSIAIALLILLGSWRLLREPFDVLMETAPAGIRERLEAVLQERFGLEHTTLQVVPEPLLQLEDRRSAPD
jgi:cobalt-zinc-cadmium efflux system protein